jgi:hypothetical protein
MDHCYDQKEKNYVTSSELPARKQQKESVRGAHQGSRESWRKRFHKTSQEMRENNRFSQRKCGPEG